MLKLIQGIVAFSIMVSMILCLLRFTGPGLKMCRVAGQGISQRTVCFGVLEFRGDDSWSFLRARAYNKFKDN